MTISIQIHPDTIDVITDIYGEDEKFLRTASKQSEGPIFYVSDRPGQTFDLDAMKANYRIVKNAPTAPRAVTVVPR